jgi:hypothetical protein
MLDENNKQEEEYPWVFATGVAKLTAVLADLKTAGIASEEIEIETGY